MEKAINKINDTINGYKKLIQVLEEHMGEDKVCRLSKKKISEKLGLSYTGTINKIKFLLKYGLIKQETGGFIIIDKLVVEHTPIGLLPILLLLVFEKPEVFYSFKQQAELLNISFENVQTAWGFYAHFFGSKNPSLEDLKVLKEQKIMSIRHRLLEKGF